MRPKTADDILSISVNTFAYNLESLVPGITDADKLELERRILFAHHLLEMVEADYTGWQARLKQKKVVASREGIATYLNVFGSLETIIASLHKRADRMSDARREHVAHSDDLYTDCLKVERICRELRAYPPAPSRMAFEVTEEDAEAIRKVLDAPPGSPGKINFGTDRVPLTTADALR